MLNVRNTPNSNSAMIISLAAMEHKSKPAKPKENIYNSKLSNEESFANDERANAAPKIILAVTFKTTRDSLHT